MLLEVTPRTSQSISITPLIDVVFILLLFFMLSSTFSKTRQLELEASAPGTQSSDTPSHNIRLLPDNNVELDGTLYAIDADTFAQHLNTMAENKASVTLAAVSSVRVQKTIRLIDRLRSVGITQLDLSPSVKP
ncbi:ExbD/TolR family protein [Amphritea opalescens]|uniref:ExbD/TolR family protein n=1 Tax=Amphritea opalescens TaxID=2490544 RepID=UPI0013DEF7C0|nr:biopolymer transporter ExbD [Amphritea opalescens]